MTIEIEKSAEKMLISMIGSLDTLAAEQIESKMAEIEADAQLPISIDCNKLDYIASSGLRILLRLRKAAAAKGNKVTLIGINQNIMEVLSITHFDKMFEIQ